MGEVGGVRASLLWLWLWGLAVGLGCGGEEAAEVGADFGQPGHYQTENWSHGDGSTDGCVLEDECASAAPPWGAWSPIGGGAFIRSGAAGLSVVRVGADGPELVAVHAEFGEAYGRFGERGVVVRGRLPGGLDELDGVQQRLLAVDLSDLEAPVVRGEVQAAEYPEVFAVEEDTGSGWTMAYAVRGPVLSPSEGDAEREERRADEVVVLHADREGVFQKSVVPIGELVRGVQFLRRDELVVTVANPGHQGGCPEGDLVFCGSGLVQFQQVDLSVVGAPRLDGARWTPQSTGREVVAAGEVLHVVGEPWSGDRGVRVETVRADTHASLGMVEVEAFELRQVWPLPQGRLGVVVEPMHLGTSNSLTALWTFEVSTDGAPGVLGTVELPAGTRVLGTTASGERLIASGGGAVLVLDPTAQDAETVVVGRTEVGWPSALGDRSVLLQEADGQSAVWVFREELDAGGDVESASVVRVAVEGEGLGTVEAIPVPHSAWSAVALPEGRVGVMTEHDWHVLDTVPLGEVGRVPLERPRLAYFEFGGHGVRHVFNQARRATTAGWIPDVLEVLAVGAEPDMSAPVLTVELGVAGPVLRDGSRLVVVGQDPEGVGAVETWDLADPTRPVRVGGKEARAFTRVGVYRAAAQLPPRLVMHDGVIVAIAPYETWGGAVTVVETRGEGGPSVSSLSIGDDAFVAAMAVDEAGVSLSTLRRSPDAPRVGRMSFVRLETGGPSGPRLGSGVNVPGMVQAAQGDQLVTVQQLRTEPYGYTTAVHRVRVAGGQAQIQGTLRPEFGVEGMRAWFTARGEVLVGLPASYGVNRWSTQLYVGGAGWSSPRAQLDERLYPAAVVGPWLLGSFGAGSVAVEIGEDAPVRADRLLPASPSRAEPVEGGWAVVGSDGVISFLPAP